MCHDVTPMACGIPYGQEDWFVFFFGFGQCFFAPGIPVHGVVRVLEEIRGCGVREFVHGVYGMIIAYEHKGLEEAASHAGVYFSLQ